MNSNSQSEHLNPLRSLARKLLVELSIYFVLLVICFFVMKISLEDLMQKLFHENLGLYGLIGLGLIIFQGVVVEIISSFLANRIIRDRLE